MIMSPFQITLLLRCYTTPGRHDNAASPAFFDAIALFLDEMLVENVADDTYRVTDRGIAHINQILNLSLPKKQCQWVGHDGKSIPM
jgi:hypothetical protein